MDYTIFLDRIFMFNSNFCINDLYICIFFFTFANKMLDHAHRFYLFYINRYIYPLIE